MNYLYKITNTVNDKIYIGIHKTEDINDGYMGSGKVIKAAIKKYGLENFSKEILEFFDTYEAALEREKEIVTDEFLLREDVYNLRRGGTGGFDYINREGLSIRNIDKNNTLERSKLANKRKDELSKMNSEWRTSYNKKMSISMKEFYKDKPGYFSGRKHSVETKQKQSNSHKGKTSGILNSQYGTMWITNGTENKKVQKNSPIPEGWEKGRKINSV